MMKSWLAGAAAFAMTMGVASAQDMPSGAPASGGYTATQTQKTYDSNGVETDKTKTYNSGASGDSVKSTKQSTAPDGSQHTSTTERTTGPDGDTTVSHTTTTKDSN